MKGTYTMENSGKLYVQSKRKGIVWEIVNRNDTHVFLERVPDRHELKVRLAVLTEKYQPVTETEAEREAQEVKIGILVTPDPRDQFQNLIVESSVRESIEVGIQRIEKADILKEMWGLDEIEPMIGKSALNFYGPPGTGKTMSARAVAQKLGKLLLQVDYASLRSKWVGDTGKHIRECFTEAKKKDAILFFDEADTMLSRRTELTDDQESNSVNQNRNILMQELDRFDGIVIFATNLFGNYDEALLRRIARHVKFELPDLQMRKELFEFHTPKKLEKNNLISGKLDLRELSTATKGFSGGDIKNVMKHSIETAAVFDRPFNQNLILEEIAKIGKSKTEHRGSVRSRQIGFGLSRFIEEE